MNKNLLLSLINKVVRLNRGRQESRIGKIIASEEDHFVILTEKDGIMYYNMHHINSITINSRDGMKFNVEDPVEGSYLLAPNFQAIVSGLSYQWVKVNLGGPEMIEGIMQEVTDEYITLFAKDEVVRVAMYHVRNISLGATSKKDDKGKEKESERNSDKVNNNEASNNATNDNAASNNVVKNDTTKSDIVKNEITKNDIVKNATAKNVTTKNDKAKNDTTKNDATKNTGETLRLRRRRRM